MATLHILPTDILVIGCRRYQLVEIEGQTAHERRRDEKLKDPDYRRQYFKARGEAQAAIAAMEEPEPPFLVDEVAGAIAMIDDPWWYENNGLTQSDVAMATAAINKLREGAEERLASLSIEIEKSPYTGTSLGHLKPTDKVTPGASKTPLMQDEQQAIINAILGNQMTELPEIEEPFEVNAELMGRFRPRSPMRDYDIRNWTLWLKTSTEEQGPTASVAIGQGLHIGPNCDYELLASNQDDICCHEDLDTMLWCAQHVLETGAYGCDC